MSETTPPPPNSSEDAQAALREESWKTYYRAYCSQLLADLAAGRWQGLDQITKVIVALFSTGSAVAGFSLWTSNHGQVAWMVCAGVATVLSIIQSSLGVSDRLKTMLESRTRMLRIRLQFETLFSDMRIEKDKFDFVKGKERFNALRQDYLEAAAQMPKDWIYSTRDESEVQETVNQILGVKPVAASK